MNLVPLLSINLGIVLGVLILLWLVSLIKKDASIIDPVWGTGFVIVAFSSLLLADEVGWRSWLIVAMVTLWGLRLSVFLWYRNFGKEEDYRYQQMREKHGDRFWWVSLFTVFLLQGVLLWFVAFPIQWGLASSDPWPFNPLDVIGIGLWATGLFFETVGDAQMARFKSNPDNQGQVMDQGLWRYTRHPNYFGDFCVWWGIYLVAISNGAVWTIASPILMSILLMKVSGVGLLEKTIGKRRPGYEEYKQRTNAFFPGPRKSAG